MICIKCGKESGKSKFCRSCREVKQNAVSIVSQNKSKLIKLLNGDYLTPSWIVASPYTSIYPPTTTAAASGS